MKQSVIKNFWLVVLVVTAGCYIKDYERNNPFDPGSYECGFQSMASPLTDGGVILGWNRVYTREGPEAAQYVVWRRESNTGVSPEEVARVYSSQVAGPPPGCEDWDYCVSDYNGIPGTDYTYFIWAANDAGESFCISDMMALLYPEQPTYPTYPTGPTAQPPVLENCGYSFSNTDITRWGRFYAYSSPQEGIGLLVAEGFDTVYVYPITGIAQWWSVSPSTYRVYSVLADVDSTYSGPELVIVSNNFMEVYSWDGVWLTNYTLSASSTDHVESLMNPDLYTDVFITTVYTSSGYQWITFSYSVGAPGSASAPFPPSLSWVVDKTFYYYDSALAIDMVGNVGVYTTGQTVEIRPLTSTTVYLTQDLAFSSTVSEVAAGDLDADGYVDDAVFVSYRGDLYGFLDVGRAAGSTFQFVPADPIKHVIVSDIDPSRSGLEIIASSYWSIYALDYNGFLIGSFPVSLTPDAGTIRQIIAADVDGDNIPEIIYASIYEIRAIDYDYNSGNWSYVDGFYIQCSGGSEACKVLIHDLDGDGRGEVWVADYNAGSIGCWELQRGMFSFTGTDWLMEGRDPGNSHTVK